MSASYSDPAEYVAPSMTPKGVLQPYACGLKLFDTPVHLEPDCVGWWDRNRKRTAFLELFCARRDTATPERMQAFFAHHWHLEEPVSFEIVGNAAGIRHLLVCHDTDVRQFELALDATFRHHFFKQLEEDPLYATYDTELRGSGMDFWFVELALHPPFFAPLPMPRTYDPDPLEGVYALFASLKPPELGIFQVLVVNSEWNWPVRLRNLLADAEEVYERNFLNRCRRLVEAKVGGGVKVFIAVPRCAIVARDGSVSFDALPAVFHPFRTDDQNGCLLSASDFRKSGIDQKKRLHAFLNRVSYRKGFPMNTAELAGLVHVPSEAILARNYKIETTGTAVPIPEKVQGEVFTLGTATYRGERAPVTISQRHRLDHMYVVGKTAIGKSTFFQSMILQDIADGVGFAVIDPHRDLVDWVFGQIPDERIDDVVVLDPTDAEHPLPFNVLQAASKDEQQILASEVSSIFRRVTHSWGPRMGTILDHAVAAVCEHPDPLTLEDLEEFLVDDKRRAKILNRVANKRVKAFFRKRYAAIPQPVVEPILTRLDAFLGKEMIERLVTQRDMVDFRELIDNGGIFLAPLEEGKLQPENMETLGSLVMAKFYQAALSRSDIPKDQRRPFFIYLDEFQYFVTDEMQKFLSGTRKFGLGLVLAHQDLQQIKGRSKAVWTSAITNAGTVVSFLVPHDAPEIAKYFEHFEDHDFRTLQRFEAIMKVGTADCDMRVRTPSWKELPGNNDKRRDAVLQHVWSRLPAPEPVEKDVTARRQAKRSRFMD